MKQNWQIKVEDENRPLAIAKVAKEAAELVHCAVEAKAEVSEIEQVLETNDHVKMWETLQRFLAIYWRFIVGTSPFTNITMVVLTREMMKIITTEAIRHQLKIMIGFVYASHALNGACRIAFQECFSSRVRKLRA